METSVVHISAESIYVPAAAWAAMMSGLGPALRTWIAALVPSALAVLGDSFRWAVRTQADVTLIDGTLRLAASHLDVLLAKSGVAAPGGTRWFIRSGLRPCSVTWHRAIPHETSIDFANRVAALAGSGGIARGSRSLGVRGAPAISSDVVTRHWTFTSVPRRLEAPEFIQAAAKAFDYFCQMTLVRKSCS
jgi:hypothetical protein